MRRFLDRLYLLCGAAAALCLIAIGLLVLTSIISRPLGLYIPGLNAYAGYAMAASSFFALAYTFRRGGHIRVNLVLNQLSHRPRWFFEIWCHTVAAGFAGYLAWFCYKMVAVSIDFGDVSEGPDATPLWIPQTALALGSAVFTLAIVDRLIEVIRKGPEQVTSVVAGDRR